MAKIIRWGLKDLIEVIDNSLNNKFDQIIFIDGNRGLGKSTLAYKLCKMTECGFKPNRDMHFKREDVVRALASQTHSVIFADELVNVAYNRDFYLNDQKELLKALNMYRDHCNCFIGCVPNFTTLDNQIKQLCKIRITIERRGVAIIHRPIKSAYNSDKWDMKNNQKVEAKYIAMHKPIPYHKFTTAVGILRFEDLSQHDREIYEKIKDEKRNQIFGDNIGIKYDSFLENMYKELIENKLTKEKFEDIIRLTGKNPKSLRENLNRHLMADGKKERVPYFFFKAQQIEKEKNKIARVPQKQMSIINKLKEQENEMNESVVAIATTQPYKEEVLPLTSTKQSIYEIRERSKRLREKLLSH